jgi:hypothetical protein
MASEMRWPGVALAIVSTLGMVIAGAPASSAPSSSQAATSVGTASRCAQPGRYDLPRGAEVVDLDPADFSARIDHPYWPMRVGTVWHYVERGGGVTQRVTVSVTRRTRLVDGIRARVVHDVVREQGGIVEDTHDWYAQDSGGSVWYLGEATAEYDGGSLVSTEGSWEHGIDGAQAGVLLPARPVVGCRYREEYKPGEAEDRALILARSESITTPTGHYRQVLHTANSTPLEPDVLENKLYAGGVGPVVEIDLSPGWSRSVLVRVTHR